MNQSVPSTSPNSSAPSPRVASDDGVGFAISLVLLMAALIGGAAVLADFINRAG